MKSLLLCFTLILSSMLSCFATTFTVSSFLDDGSAGTLRKVIATAAATSGNTVIVPAGTYVLSSTISFGTTATTLTISGTAGSTFIQMGSSTPNRIFFINPPGTVANLNVTITGLTFENGVDKADHFGGGAILCGGPANTTTIQDCVFTGNSGNTTTASNGGALAMEGGGTFIIQNCVFNNNVNPLGNGGAVLYDLSVSQSASLTMTGCTFTNNSCSASGAFGGAMLITITAAPSHTSAISITQNTFTGNSVSGTGSYGGAIVINNSFASGNTAFINYNRFYANKAAYIPDVMMGNTVGSVDVTNNWWGSNNSPTGADPHAAIVSGTPAGGSLIATTWLELRTTAASSTVCGGAGGNTTVTASFQENSAAATVSTLSEVVGVPVSFTAANGSVTGASSVIASDGTATATFVTNGTLGAAGVRAVVDSVSTTDVTADATLTVNAPSALPLASTSSTFTVGGSLPAADASCNKICLVVPSGASPISGTVTASVTIDPSVQSALGQPYLTRHYDITPAANASTATAMVTLYFLQSEFNAYNALVSNPSLKLPTSSTDATGKANLTITQFHGTGTAPGNYSGWTGPGSASVLISPGASNVLWNSASNWWEVSFPVTGFSGFFVTGPISVPLPVVLEHFAGAVSGSGVLLNWKVGEETGLLRYEVEGSTDGVGFSTLGSVAGGTYQFFVSNPAVGKNYYRLKMVNTDGTFDLSSIIVVDVMATPSVVQVLSNPFAGPCALRVNVPVGGPLSLRLTDVSGKVLWHEEVALGAGVNTFVLPLPAGLARGIYFLEVQGESIRQTVKLVKE